MKKFFLYLLFIMACSTHATEQINDILIVDGAEHEIEVMPFGHSPLENLYDFNEIHTMLQSDGWCSANWRGYKGTWEIKDSQLYLNELVKDACSESPKLIDPALFFGESSYPVRVTWLDEPIKIRLSASEPIYCKGRQSIENIIGYSYDAMVYDFLSGSLTGKSKQRINDIFQRSKKECEEREQ